MKTTGNALPADAKQAIEDLRRIRKLVENTRVSAFIKHLISTLRPLMALLGVLLAAALVGMQLLLDLGPATILGMGKTTALWVIGAVITVLMAAGKTIAFGIIGRREGYSLGRVIAELYTGDYFKVALLWIPVGAAGAAALILTGAGEATVGFISACLAGAIASVGLTVIPIRNFVVLGLGALVLGIAAMFLLPGYPFLKIAVIWGLPLIAAGLVKPGGADTRDAGGETDEGSD